LGLKGLCKETMFDTNYLVTRSEWGVEEVKTLPGCLKWMAVAVILDTTILSIVKLVISLEQKTIPKSDTLNPLSANWLSQIPKRIVSFRSGLLSYSLLRVNSVTLKSLLVFFI